MADRHALGTIGWAFGAVTAVVLMTAAVVVTSHAEQWPSAGAARLVTIVAPPAGVR